MTCPSCHHRPSGRTADYGATCHCVCHDAADASPDLLAALKGFLHADPDVFETELAAARAAIRKAEGVTV